MDLMSMLAMGGANLKVEVTIQDLAAFGQVIAQKAVDDLKDMIAESNEKAKNADESPWLSSAQVCKKLGIGKSTLYNYHQQGIIIPVKIGGQNRYDPEQVKQLLVAKGLPGGIASHPDVHA